jgi:hypothetical protein
MQHQQHQQHQQQMAGAGAIFSASPAAAAASAASMHLHLGRPMELAEIIAEYSGIKYIEQVAVQCKWQCSMAVLCRWHCRLHHANTGRVTA